MTDTFDGVPVFELPPLRREMFPDDETYRKATSHTRDYDIRPNAVDITGLDKAALLAALYERAEPVGLGWLQAGSAPASLDRKQALALLEERPVFDYLFGRPLKIDLSGTELVTTFYNRDQGPDAAEEVVKRLRREQEMAAAIERAETEDEDEDA